MVYVLNKNRVICCVNLVLTWWREDTLSACDFDKMELEGAAFKTVRHADELPSNIPHFSCADEEFPTAAVGTAMPRCFHTDGHKSLVCYILLI